MRLVASLTLSASLLAAGCSSKDKAAPAPSPSAAPAAPAAPVEGIDKHMLARPRLLPPPLGETPADRLGTAPEGLGLAAVTKAPDATLVDASGAPVTLASLYAKGPTFVIFYRGGWCSFCNQELHALGEARASFDAAHVGLVAISVDRPGEASKTQAAQGVAFPVLSDPKLVAHQAFHVVKANTPDEVAKLAAVGIDLGAFSGESYGSFAVPAVFLVDATGVIRFAHVDPDFTTRPSPAQLLAVAQAKLGKK